MKKFFKILFGFFVVVFLAIVITMLALGKEYHFEKTVTINAPVEKVWRHVNSMKGINSWSPFMKMDPNMEQSYSGTPGAVGEKYTWSGNDKAGQGEEVITEMVPNEKMVVDLHFVKPFESKANAVVFLEPEGDGTKVTWSFDTTMDYPTNIMKLFINSQMDKSFTDGLNSLKAMSEKAE
jgi:uncharacterized protein YndB with AHSA1/START domain